MCTLIALFRCHPSAPLVFALNRDEFLSRPTTGTELWDGADPADRIVAGRDVLSGGTWFGIGRNIVAALTNHHSGDVPKPRERTRGELVTRSLRQPDLAALRDDLASLPPEAFGAFHLLASDGNEMAWVTNRSGRMEIETVEPGLHILGNHGLDDKNDQVVATMHRELNGLAELPDAELIEKLKTTLASHGPGCPCVHRDVFGTRSSAILQWGNDRPTLIATEGAPCENDWRDHGNLLAQLTTVSSD